MAKLPVRKMPKAKVNTKKNVFANSAILTTGELNLTDSQFRRIVDGGSFTRHGVKWTGSRFDPNPATPEGRREFLAFIKTSPGNTGIISGTLNGRRVLHLVHGSGLPSTASKAKTKAKAPRRTTKAKADITPSQALRRIDRTLEDAGVR